ncbi:hypothetical protein CRG98_003318 [Punica granatum]|uniref:Reverse transcriptase domain-containing protein n=1 Tax=Punica granatum TaxID=22663 RepID=A0A2I0L6N3_PUNGR|nr:hypothetical protein CRG98_003318 [Punica granatum]
MVTLFHDMMHKEVEVYFDDIIAKSKKGEDHLVNLKRLFDRLKEYKLRLNTAKCTFGARSGKLLGFVVSERGIEVDLDKVKAIKELPPPSSVCEVRGFLEATELHRAIHRKLDRQMPTILPLAPQERSDRVGRRMPEGFRHHQGIPGSTARISSAHTRLPPHPLSNKFPIEDNTPINSDFPDEGTLQVDSEEEKPGWKMYFDGAVNSTGSGIGAVLISPVSTPFWSTGSDRGLPTKARDTVHDRKTGGERAGAQSHE